MPPFSDSAIDVDSKFREAMLRKGMALRVIAQGQYAQNMLDAPVGADEQVYVGQRAFAGAMVQPILTTDLRQLHLRNAQLYLGGVWNWVSWDPAGPKAFQLWDAYLYKAFGEDRVEADLYVHTTYVLMQNHEGWRLAHIHCSPANAVQVAAVAAAPGQALH